MAGDVALRSPQLVMKTEFAGCAPHIFPRTGRGRPSKYPLQQMYAVSIHANRLSSREHAWEFSLFEIDASDLLLRPKNGADYQTKERRPHLFI